MPTLKKFINILIQYITVLNNANDEYQRLYQFRNYLKDLNYHLASKRFRKEVSEEIKLVKDTEELQDFFINLEQREKHLNCAMEKAMGFFKDHNIFNPSELEAHFQMKNDIIFFKKLIQHEKDKYDLFDSKGKSIPKPAKPISAKVELKYEQNLSENPIKIIYKLKIKRNEKK